MKSRILYSLIFICFGNVAAQHNFCIISLSVNGFNKNDKKEVVLVRRDTNVDSLVFKRYTFKLNERSIKIFANEPFFCDATLTVNGIVVSRSSSFLITNSRIFVSFSAKSNKAEISGGENDFYFKHRFLLFSLPYEIASNSKYSTITIRNQYDLNIEDMRLRFYYEEYEQNIVDIVAANKSRYVILMNLLNRKELISLKTLERCYALLTDTLKSTSKGKQLKLFIDNEKNLFVGLLVPQFKIVNGNNEEINSENILHSNKYVLIDFWATWCTPCRQRMKELEVLFNTQIDTTKLQIISISIDDKYEIWENSFNKERLPWLSYFAPGCWEGETAHKFNLTYLPQNRLISPDGKIIGFDLWDDKLALFLQTYKLKIAL